MVREREYFRCGECGLIHVPSRYHLSPASEKERYDLHDNTITNPGYTSYLSGVADAAMPFVKLQSRVLDFGSGKEAVLTVILRERGVDCTPYDPLYGITFPAESGGFDLVIMCEVIEHCKNMAGVIEFLQTYLLPGGALLVKTQLYPSCAAIDTWWYSSDPTHIMLFSEKSIETFAGSLPGKLENRLAKDLFLIRKD